jgi:hypothetical protein
MKNVTLIGLLFERSVLRYLGVIDIGEVSIKCSINLDTDNLLFSTILYSSNSKIPENILERANTKVVFAPGTSKAKITIDEESQVIYLSFEEHLEQVNYSRFTEQLDEFAWLAKEYKKILNEKLCSKLTFAYINRY